MNDDPNLLDDLHDQAKRLQALIERVEQMRGDHADELKVSQCGRALLLAYTNMEQAGLWLGKAMTIRDQEMVAEYARNG